MKKSILFIVVILFFLVFACKENKKTSSINESNLSFQKNLKFDRHNIDGYWILSNYLDSILKDKTIAKHRLYPISWSTLFLNINNENLTTTGLIYGNFKKKLEIKNDTLFEINKFGNFIFHYDRITDKIIATNQESKSGVQSFTYRRVVEKNLLEILKNYNRYDIEVGIYQMFIDSIISGNYKSLDNKHQFSLTSDGFSKGFKKFNQYKIHSYFGTSHPFHNYDAINFSNKKLTDKKTSNSFDNQWYNWRFSNDTLILSELLTENFDEYFIGKKSYRFLKI